MEHDIVGEGCCVFIAFVIVVVVLYGLSQMGGGRDDLASLAVLTVLTHS